MKRKNYIFSSRDDWNKVYFCNIPEMIDKIKKMSLVELYGEDVLGEIN